MTRMISETNDNCTNWIWREMWQCMSRMKINTGWEQNFLLHKSFSKIDFNGIAHVNFRFFTRKFLFYFFWFKIHPQQYGHFFSKFIHNNVDHCRNLMMEQSIEILAQYLNAQRCCQRLDGMHNHWMACTIIGWQHDHFFFFSDKICTRIECGTPQWSERRWRQWWETPQWCIMRVKRSTGGLQHEETALKFSYYHSSIPRIKYSKFLHVKLVSIFFKYSKFLHINLECQLFKNFTRK